MWANITCLWSCNKKRKKRKKGGKKRKREEEKKERKEEEIQELEQFIASFRNDNEH